MILSETLFWAGMGIAGIILFFRLVAIIGESYWKKHITKDSWTILQIKPNKLSEKNPAVAEQIFSSLHGIQQKHSLFERITGKPQEKFSLEISNTKGHIFFSVRTPRKYVSFVQGQFYAHYPDAEITITSEYSEDIVQQNIAWTELRFSGGDIWPIKRHSQFEDRIAGVLNDPLAGILEPLSQMSDGISMSIQFSCQPLLASVFSNRGMEYLSLAPTKVSFFRRFERMFLEMDSWKRFFSYPFRFLLRLLFARQTNDVNAKSAGDNAPKMEMSKSHDKENETIAATDKMSKSPFFVSIRVACHYSGKKQHEAEHKVKEVCGAFRQFSLPQLNGFTHDRIHSHRAVFWKRFFSCDISRQMILNTEELATLFHLPNETVSTPHIHWVTARKLEPPQNIPLAQDHPKEEITILGKTNFRNAEKTFGILRDDRRRHMYVAGKTGMGKSTILENMIFSDIEAGRGVAVIDPHGDLAEAVLDFVPKSRTNDVVIFDPSDRDHPVSFNMLECKNENHRHLIASGVVGVFKKMFAESWGPRLEHILRNTLLALIEAGGSSTLGIMRILSDEKYRKQILKKVSDPMVTSFWRDEFGAWTPKQIAEAISPIQNKVGQFLSSSLIRNIIGQSKSSIDLRFAMDTGKIIIINLSKGKIGEDNSALLGSMLITKFQLDVMSRADIPEKERRDFYLYVDEFQNFATDSFATILSEARKYRLNLTVANQYLAQMSDEVREAVFGNVGTIGLFQVGFDDAEVAANQFGGDEVITSADIGSLPKYQIYIRLMVNGMPSPVFSVDTLPPPMLPEDDGRKEKIIRSCRMRYSRPREQVEKQIKKWAES